MESIYLICDIGKDAVINPDNITLLRGINLVQGTTYNVFLAFVNDGVPIDAPTIATFSFAATYNGNSVFSSALATPSGNSSYPIQFEIIPASDNLTAALVGQMYILAAAQISWSNGATTTTLAPFTARVAVSVDVGEDASFVSAVNSLEGAITLTGANGINVSTSGQEIVIDGTATAFYKYVNTTYTASAGDKLACDTSSAPFTVTLPETPVVGNTVVMTDAASTWNTNNLTLNMNGAYLQGASDYIVCNAPATLSLVYVSPSFGWQIA